MTDAHIFDALRPPRCKGRKDGSLHEVTTLRLSADILYAVKNRDGLAARSPDASSCATIRVTSRERPA